MTIQQIRYVIEVARCGSINKAAKELYTTQPNISNAIKNLEEELNISLFKRSSSGMTLTEVGKKFIQHSRTLLYEMESLEALQDDEAPARLTICAATYPAIDHAFVRLCRQYQGRGQYQFTRRVMNLLDTIEAVAKGTGDMGILAFNVRQNYSIQVALQNYELHYERLFQLPLSIQLRPDHPLLCAEGFDRNRLWDYPFIHYDESGKTLSGNAGLSAFPFINPARSISVSNPNTRWELIQQTDAYGFACPVYLDGCLQTNVVSIPLGIEMEFGAVYRQEEPPDSAAAQFLRNLHQDVGK